MLKFLEIIFINEKYLYYIPLIFLILVWLFKKNWFHFKILKTIFLILFCFLFGIALIKTIANYFTWFNNPFSRNLLPPITPIFYFLRYSFQHYFFSPILNIAFSLIVYFLMIKFNKKFQESFFYEEEPYLAAIGILITGWPNCLVYLALVLLCGIFSHFTLLFLSKIFKELSYSSSTRLSFYYFWLPCALLVLFLSGIISKNSLIQSFIAHLS